MAFRCTLGEMHVSDYLLAHIGSSVVGSVLSLALFPIMGGVLLLFDNQLFDCWLWRCSSPANVADLRPHRKRHWRTDVRLVREPPVCDRDATS